MASATAVYFVVHASRGKAAANALLGRFGGIVVTDDFGAYNDVSRHRRQLCWAHVLRHFIGMGERRGNAGEVGRRLELIALAVFRTRHRLDRGEIDTERYRRRIFTGKFCRSRIEISLDLLQRRLSLEKQLEPSHLFPCRPFSFQSEIQKLLRSLLQLACSSH